LKNYSLKIIQIA